MACACCFCAIVGNCMPVIFASVSGENFEMTSDIMRTISRAYCATSERMRFNRSETYCDLMFCAVAVSEASTRPG